MFWRRLRWRYRKRWLGLVLIGAGLLVLLWALPGWFFPVALGMALILIGLIIFGKK